MKSVAPSAGRRFLVVSDFHVTSGKDQVSGRWSPTEDFFWDDTFRDFLAGHATRPPTTLIINGDLFDFLQVLVFPTVEEREEYQIPTEEINRAYGLQCSEACCEFQIEQIMDGHEVMLQALADFLAAGNNLRILKGNHDIQLHWPKVQERIFLRLQRFAERTNGKIAREQVKFMPWFYYVPGLLYVEHGNQFEETTAFRNFLTPILPRGDEDRHNPQIELDLSSLLVRYLTNRLEPINPLADNIRPLSRYYGMMWKKYPYLMISTLGTAFRFVLKAFGKAREMKRGSVRLSYEKIVEENKRSIRMEAERFAGPDPENIRWLERHLLQFDKRRSTPTLEKGAWTFLGSLLAEGAKGILWLAPLYLLTFMPDVGNAVLGWVKGLDVGWLTTVVEFLHRANLLHILIVVIVGALLIWLRGYARKKIGSGEENRSSVMPDVSKEMRGSAQYVARSLGVKFVTFGHTHYADTCALFDGGRYFNTGTWMGIFEEGEQLYRNAHQFTYLAVEGERAELLRWNPDARCGQPVVVVDTETPLTGDEDSMVKLMMRALKF